MKNPDAVQAVHRQRTHERIAAIQTPVLFIHDTTQLTFSRHAAVADQLGPIDDGANCARGFLQHNSLVVDPTGSQLLGLIQQQTVLRTPRPAGEFRAARYQRTDRESRVWTQGIEAVGRPTPDRLWIHVGDRGADFFGAMATVAMARRGGRPAQMATVKLGAVRLTIRATRADPLWRAEPPITLSVVRIWEENPPPDVEPLEWILGTDLADVSSEALRRYQSWYERWWKTMEEYHKVQKTGCRIEDLRFASRERLYTAIALVSVVAVRILQLRWSQDACPNAPASAVASAEELQAVQAARPGRAIVTVKQFVDRVAGLSGYLGRKCDGPPG